MLPAASEAKLETSPIFHSGGRRGQDLSTSNCGKGRALCAREYDAYERSLAAIFDALPDAERGPMFSGLERMTRLLRVDGSEKAAGARVDERRRRLARTGT